MANTMKFGNGQWATKKDSILAYNDENANFKPLPFTASRASTATVVNKAGLLETVASGIPRVDYLSNTSGAYLLEPSSTNLITQSEAFGNSYWAKSGASIEGDASTAGSEKVVNGDFATDSDWTKGSAWTISGGVANYDYSATSEFASIGSNLIVGKLYQLKFNLVGTSARIYLTSALGWKTLTTGSYNYAFYATDSELMFMGANDGGRSAFTLDNVSVKEVQGFASPSASSPLGAFKLVASTTTDYISATAISTGNNNITVSYFVKADTLSNFSIVEAFYFGTVTNFDLSLETSDNGKIEKIGNGWYRCSASYTYGVGQEIIATQLKTGAIGSIYIFGAQLEAQSYPTSYIPTAGSQITRLAETAIQTVPDGIISNTEGVLYVDVTNLGRSQNTNILTKNSIVNSVYGYFQTNDKIKFGLFANSVSIPIESSSQYPVGTRTKIALHYKSGNTKLYVNGSLEGTSSDAFTLGSDFADDLRLLDASSAYFAFPGKSILNEFKAYNTVLTDAELVKLTTI